MLEIGTLKSQLRCELVRDKDPQLFSDVSFKLDRVCTDFQAALHKPGIEPWIAVQDARRKIVEIQKQVAEVKASNYATVHGNEAGTTKGLVTGASARSKPR